MAIAQHVDILMRNGAAAWNQWRAEHAGVQPDLSGADLSGADLSAAHLVGANLRGATLSRADLSAANLQKADLCEARLIGTDLSRANLGGANLSATALGEALLIRADLTSADLSGADLTGADLTGARCIKARFTDARLVGCVVNGIAAWDVDLSDATQADLRFAPPLPEAVSALDESAIIVDNLEVAHILYLLLRSQAARAIFASTSTKLALILGAFGDRQPVRDAVRDALRRHPNGYTPVVFELDPQHDESVLESLQSLAGLARFIIADLTDPDTACSALATIFNHVPAIPVQPIIQDAAELPAEHAFWALRPSYLPVYRYADASLADPSQLVANVSRAVIEPLEVARARAIQMESA